MEAMLEIRNILILTTAFVVATAIIIVAAADTATLVYAKT